MHTTNKNKAKSACAYMYKEHPKITAGYDAALNLGSGDFVPNAASAYDDAEYVVVK